jgi:hypothetical protein
MLPAIALAITVIFFLGFYDFGLDITADIIKPDTNFYLDENQVLTPIP